MRCSATRCRERRRRRRGRPDAAGSTGNDRHAMAPAWLCRVRRPSGSHCPASAPVCRGEAMDGSEGVRRRHRHDEPAPRPGIDTAGHLLRLAFARSGRRRCRRGVFHRPQGSCSSWRWLQFFLANHPPDWILGRRSQQGPPILLIALHAAWRLVPASWGQDWERAGSARPLGRLRPARRCHRCHCRALPRDCDSRLRSERADVPPARQTVVSWLDEGVHPSRCPPRGDGGWSRRSGVGGVQGGGSLLWRWLRDRPVDAARRRHDLPLDDRRTVP